MQINLLKEIAEKAGLKISFGKTEYLTNVKQSPKTMKTKYGEIKKVPRFEYLGEMIESNAQDKEGNRARLTKIKRAFFSPNQKCVQ